MAQSGRGRMEIFEDFYGAEVPVANTNTTDKIGSFRVIGQGLNETDAGVVSLETDGLSGVAQLTTTNEAEHTTGLATAKMFDVALMAPLIAEARIRFTDLDTKEFYFGFTDVNDDTAILEGGNIHGTGTTVTLTASDLCGFHFSSEYTDDEDWHMVYNGGTTTGETTSSNIDADDDAVAGEWQELRLVVNPNGTAEWWIDGVLQQTTAGAVSTTTDLALLCMVEAKGSATESVDVDYILIRANRDWTK